MVQSYKTVTEKGIASSFSLASPLGAYFHSQHDKAIVNIEWFGHDSVVYTHFLYILSSISNFNFGNKNLGTQNFLFSSKDCKH